MLRAGHTDEFAAPGPSDPPNTFAVGMTLPDGSEETMSGTYVELVPNERLVTTMNTPEGPTSPMVMDLEEVPGGRTKVTFAQACPTEELRDFGKEGSEMLLEWVADYVTKA